MDLFVADDPNEMLVRTGRNILLKLDRIQMLCKEVALALSAKEA